MKELSTDLERDFPDYPPDLWAFTKNQLKLWISGVLLGCFIGAFITIASLHILDLPCTAGKFCSEHNKK